MCAHTQFFPLEWVQTLLTFVNTRMQLFSPNTVFGVISMLIQIDTQRYQQLRTGLWVWAGPCSKAMCNCIKSSRSVVKNLPANARDAGSTPGSGAAPGHPLQCSGLENPMDRGAWWGYGPWVTKSRTVPILKMKNGGTGITHPLFNSGNCHFPGQN